MNEVVCVKISARGSKRYFTRHKVPYGLCPRCGEVIDKPADKAEPEDGGPEDEIA